MLLLNLYSHHSRLNSSFFTRIILSYAFLLILFFLITATAISISSLRFGNIDFYAKDEFQEYSLEDSRSNIIEHIIVRGESFNSILNKYFLTNEDKQNIMNVAKNIKLDKHLKVGSRLFFEYDTQLVDKAEEDLSEEYKILKQITYDPGNNKKIEIIRSDNKFITRNFSNNFKKVFVRYSTSIKKSVLESARTLNVSTNNIIEVISAYSHQVDFQRQVREGDELNIVVEKFYNENGEFSHQGKILFASLILSGKKYNIYKFSPGGDKQYQYFSEDARSVKSNLLRTPLKVIRITSHFGSRFHPIDGYTKVHTGVDYAAPTGTPIYAAGDGIVVDAGWKNGYGKYIKIQHNNSLSTAYAHAQKFSSNLHKGSIVKQGQVIAYVGSTGKSTSPHLHYEILINNRPVNPLSVKTIPALQLTGQKLHKFENFKNSFRVINEKLNKKLDVAADEFNI